MYITRRMKRAQHEPALSPAVPQALALARSAAALALISVAAMVLTGCVGTSAPTASTDPGASASQSPSDSPSGPTSQVPTTTPTPTPAPTPTPTDAANVLFTISATVTAPNNAKVDFMQTVYTPVATTAAMTTDTALLDKQCSGWQTMFPSRKFVTTEITSKLQPGSPAWPKNAAIGVDMDGYPAWSGNYTGFQALCASVIVTVGGHIHGIIPVPSSHSADAKMGWARADYGFGIASGSDSGTAPGPKDLRITSCSIILSSTATATSAIAPKWATQAQAQPASLCRFGVGY